MIAFASILERNHSMPRHSSRKRPLKLSFVPFCEGVPSSTSRGPGDELRAVVGAEVRRRAVDAHEAREDVDHAAGADPKESTRPVSR
jgi:hypothetical protein